jgi:hypothetical protein
MRSRKPIPLPAQASFSPAKLFGERLGEGSSFTMDRSRCLRVFFKRSITLARNQLTAVQTCLALTIVRPQMQAPGLVIREMPGNGVDDAIRPGIDRRSVDFDGIWQRLPGKGEPAGRRVSHLRRCRGPSISLCADSWALRRSSSARNGDRESESARKRCTRWLGRSRFHRFVAGTFSLKGETTPRVDGRKSSVRKQEAGRPSAFMRLAPSGQLAQA